MQSSKLIEIFYKLNKNHIYIIKNNLLSSKKSAHPVSLLFDYILNFYPNNLSKPELEKEIVYKSISKKKEYNEKQMLKWMSNLFKYVEQAIAQEAFEKDIYYQKNVTAKFYLKNNLIKYFDVEVKEIDGLINENEDNLTFLKKYELEELCLERQLNDNNRNSDYQSLYNYLVSFYNTNLVRLKNLSITVLRNNVVEYEPENNLYKIHQQISKLLIEEDIENFDDCFKTIRSNLQNIKNSEIKICIMILINFCIIKINNKTPIYLEKLFSLYLFLSESNLILEDNNTISISTYKNFCTVGLRLGQIEFVEKFILEYKNKLPKDVQNDIFQYNLAHVAFFKKEYESVLKLLSNVRYKDVFYKLSSRRLQIKAYFMLFLDDATYFEILESSLNAFKKYIYTNKEINEHYLANNKNFLKFANKLTSLNKNESVQFIIDLDATNQIAEYDWLKEIGSRIK